MIQTTINFVSVLGQILPRKPFDQPYSVSIECDICGHRRGGYRVPKPLAGVRRACEDARQSGWIITTEQDVCAKCVQKSVHVV